ncbi:MAG: tyrosine-type recombinase/integrase [Clostridiales bacterium]|nr:tyrosine-type recombinase/integrase [Clostridiales bacterium]
MRTTDPIKKSEDVEKLLDFYLNEDNFNLRNYLLIAVGLFTALRISDILLLKWSDVITKEGCIKNRITVKEKKTKKTNAIAVNNGLFKAFELYLSQAWEKPEGYIFKGRSGEKPLHRTQAYRIVKTAASSLNSEGNISCHSLRKTVGYHLYLNDASPILLMSVYNHSSFEITKRYLCITQYEKDEAFNNLSYT